MPRVERMEIGGVTGRATCFIRCLKLHPEIYSEFKRVMRDYSTNKLNVSDIVSELDILFRSHPDLLTNYRIFLSPQLAPTLPSLQQTPNLKILRPCIAFMNNLQKRFADKPGVIAEYLETIRALTKGKICNEEAYNAIEKIFKPKNQDLIDEFEVLVIGREGIKKKKKRKEEKKKKKKKNLSSLRNNNSVDEIMDLKEDELFERDINFFHWKTTVESVKMLMESLEKDEHQIININDYFSAVSLGYIRKKFKEEGGSIITRLRDDPRRVLPRISEKLKSPNKRSS